MSETRRERILKILAEYPEGVPTPLIARLAIEDMPDRRRAVRKCWKVLEPMEARGEVARRPAPGPTVEWRLVPLRLQRLHRALYKAESAARALTPDDWTTLPFGPDALQEFLDRHRQRLETLTVP